jgi:hypothetical protein
VDVRIRSVTGNVTALGGDALLTPEVLERIVAAVMAALDDRRLRERRAHADVRVNGCCGEDGGGAP